jgi:glycosyltransferase involved in cell wall biosynthesis
VIIPTKNVEDTLEGCLRAVLNQNGVEDSYEVIVVDDGSTDRMREIAEGFGVKVVRLEGVGPVCTANQCRSPMAMALMRKRLEDQGM